MRTRKKSITWQRVLVDICTQRDFLEPGAILQVANLHAVLPNLRHVFAWAKQNGLSTFSSIESHRPTEPLKGFPLHCIDGSRGQEKLEFSILHPYFLVEVDNCLSLPPDLGKKYRQLIFRKRGRAILSNPKADRFLTTLNADEFILVGAGLERAIKVLALALLARHKSVTVVTDACGYWSSADADLSLRQLNAKNIKLVTSEELTAPVPEPVAPRKLRVRFHRDRHHPAGSPEKSQHRSDVTKG